MVIIIIIIEYIIVIISEYIIIMIIEVFEAGAIQETMMVELHECRIWRQFSLLIGEAFSPINI